jgi:hypothetical protein
MDEKEFWAALRMGSLILGGILGAFIIVYLIFVAGYAAHAYINRIDPDPPYCVTVEKSADARGHLYDTTVKHPLTDAGQPTNLDPTLSDAGK